MVLDPITSVVADVRTQEAAEHEGKLVITVGTKTMKALAEWKSNPGLFKSKVSAEDPVMDVPNPAMVESRMFASSDFTRSIQGSANISAFLTALPRLYTARELKLLEDDGRQSSTEAGWCALEGSGELWQHLAILLCIKACFTMLQS